MMNHLAVFGEGSRSEASPEASHPYRANALPEPKTLADETLEITVKSSKRLISLLVEEIKAGVKIASYMSFDGLYINQRSKPSQHVKAINEGILDKLDKAAAGDDIWEYDCNVHHPLIINEHWEELAKELRKDGFKCDKSRRLVSWKK